MEEATGGKNGRIPDVACHLRTDLLRSQVMSEFHRQVPGLANLIRSAPITINSVMATGKRMNKLYSTGTVHLHGKLKTLSVNVRFRKQCVPPVSGNSVVTRLSVRL